MSSSLELPILSREDVEMERLLAQTTPPAADNAAPVAAVSALPIVEKPSAPEERPAWYPEPGEEFGTRLEHLDWID